MMVSIVVPVYNVQKYVGRCLDSLVSQTHEDIEIIVIEDGSTDGSRAVCEEYAKKDPRICLFTQENRGLAAVRNRGIAEAKGEYLAFVDSDDLVAPTFIEETLRITRDYDADIVATGIFAFINESEIPVDLGPEAIRTYTAKEACHALFDATVDGLGCSIKLYKMSLITEAHFPEGKLHEDEFVMYRLLYRCKCLAVTNRKLYDYQSKRPDSITHARYTLRRLDGVEAARERMAFFKETDDPVLYDKSAAYLVDTILKNLDEMETLKGDSDTAYPDQIAEKLRKEAGRTLAIVKKSRHLRMKRKVGLWLHLIAPSLWSRLA